MANYRICDLIIEIKPKYKYTQRLCADYESDPSLIPDIKVEVPTEEIEAAAALDPSFSKGYHESLCIYRAICRAMLGFNGFLFHSSVVALDGEGYVFTAKSGTGKSTHSKLWLKVFKSRSSIINGDKPIIRLIDGVFYAYGTPWCGKEGYNCNTRVPIKAVCFLAQSGDNCIRSMKTNEVLRKIFCQTIYPDTTEAIDKSITLLDKFIREIPFYEMNCTISEDAVYMAYNAMGGSNHEN
ncbi:MAG: hypothetical protein Q8882_05555 [Bacillota bacterium]|nr:hypothetical protein [Bacillota bacterium]